MNQPHELKTLPYYFEAVWSGHMTAELRKNDRDFKAGDTLILRERTMPNYPESTEGEYTGRAIVAIVMHITEFPAALREGYVMLSIKVNRMIGAYAPGMEV